MQLFVRSNSENPRAVKNFPEESMDNQSACCCDLTPIVLVVDDDLDNLILLQYQVSLLLNCSVLTASDGDTAIALASTTQPQLILMDMMLPDLDGFAVVRSLKQNPQLAHIPVIAVSAMARKKDQEAALLAGCSDYICKPYELEQLESAIHRYLLPVVPLSSIWMTGHLEANREYVDNRRESLSA